MRKWLICMLVLALGIPGGLMRQEAASAKGGEQQETSGTTEAPITMYSNKWKVIPKAAAAPAIDGTLSDGAWSGSAVLDDFRTPFYNEPVADGPSYKVTYDESNLYIGGTFGSEEKAILEKVEFLVSPQSAGELHYVVTVPVTSLATPSITDYNVGREIVKENPQRVQVDTFTYRTSELAGKTSVEVAVPLSAFSAGGAVQPGTEWRMNVVHVHHLNTKPMLSWVPIRTSTFWDTGNTPIFKVNAVDEGRLGSVFFERPPAGQPWTPEEADFQYKSFTSKELSFNRQNVVNPAKTKFALKWKTPSGDWQALDQVSHVKAGSRSVLTFEHPGALEYGMMELQVLAYREDKPNDAFFTIMTFDRDDMIRAGLHLANATAPAGTKTEVAPAPASAEVLKLLDLVPDKVGFRFTGLPEMPELHPELLYTLTADKKSMIATKTGTVYPNAQYPETHTATAVNAKGETLEYPYYEDADGKQYFLSGQLWYLQKEYTLAETERIAKTDPLGAARLLYRFAQVYEGYVPTTDYIWRNYPINITAGPPFNYWGGMWYRWSVADLYNLKPLMNALQSVKKTNALQVLSQEVGADVEKLLTERMVAPSVEYVLSYPKTLGNMNYTQWLGLIAAGKAVDEPDYIHTAVEWMRDYVETQFLSDGYWKEVAPSYHVQSTGGLETAVKAVEGYSDPAGYESPRTGIRYDELNFSKDYPLIRKSLDNNNILVYPNGSLLPIQDSWASDKAASPRLDVGSMLMPAAGIGRLSSGTGTAQSQLYLQFQPKYGHNHYDPLQLNLFAEGQELLPDLGYTYTKYRAFTLSTMGHNTVVVDGKDAIVDAVSKHGGSVETFAPAGPVQVMRADQENAYPETEQYSREPWHISFPGSESGQGYVLDLFRVSGGSRHEYTLQGDANRDAVFQTDLALDPYGPYLLPPGTRVQEPEQFNETGSAEGNYYGYIFVKDVKKAQLQDDRYDVTLVTSTAGTEQAKMKITGLLEPGENELYLARSPSIRATRLSGKSKDTNDEAVKYDMPKLVLRREGADLKSTFVTAMEPYKGTGPKIESVDRLQPSSAPEGAVAVKVTYGNTTDIILSAPEGSVSPLIVDDMTLRGQMGFIRLVDGVVQSMALIAGTELSKGNKTVIGGGPVTGTVAATKRIMNGDPYDGIVAGTPIGESEAAALRGKYVVLTHPDGTTNGYLIGDIVTEPATGQTVIVFAEYDPGFEIHADGTSRMNYYPMKAWTGPHTFRIDNVSLYDANPLQSVTLQAQKRSLLKGEKASVQVRGLLRDGSFAPAWATNIAYASSDPSVLTVDSAGSVTAAGDGTATITAAVEWNGVTRTASLLFSSQHRTFAASSFVDLPVSEQTVGTLYVAGSNTVQVEANQAGERIAFDFIAPAAETYDIALRPFQAASYGIYDILLDGNPLTTFNFYGSAGAGAAIQQLGTAALSAGKHTLTFVNSGKDPKSTNYKFGVRELEIKTHLSAPPSLSGGVIHPGGPFTASFADDAAWRAAITGVTVDGMPLASGQYSVSPGAVAIAVGAVTGIGPRRIAVHAEGYRHGEAEVESLPASALAGLTADAGTLSPPFSPGVFDYAVMVGNETASIGVTAATYLPDSVMTAGGRSYGSAAQMTVPLQVGANPLTIGVTASNGETTPYTLTLYRSERDETPTGTVTGSVYVAGSGPVAGATVKLAGYATGSVTTDAAGAFLMPHAPIGTQRVVVAKPGYTRAISDAFTLTVGQSVYVPLVMTDTVAPELNVPRPYVLRGQPVEASSVEPARLYLVPEGTAANAAALEAAAAGPNGSAADAAADTVVSLATEGFALGKYRLYARDLAGNLTPAPVPVTVIEAGAGTVDDNHPALAYAGTWQTAAGSYVGGQMQLGRDIGASVTIPFYGSRAKWIGARNAVYGKADVYVDGVFAAKVDLYNATLQTKQELFDTGQLQPGVHVMKIVATGEKNAAANGIFITLDALQVTDLGLVPPVLSSVTAGPIAAGMPVAATSSENGSLYLVPAATAATKSALEQAVVTVNGAVYGLKALHASAGVPVSFDTAGLAPGLYKAYAVGQTGAVSAGSAPIAVLGTAPAAIDNASPLASYSGSWMTVSDTRMHGGTEHVGTAANSTVEIPFYGTQAVIYGTRASNGALADIYVDGVLRTTYDYYYGGTGLIKQQIWDTGTLPLGVHTIKIVDRGEKNPLSKNIWIRFDVLQTAV
ncbi:cadherin-like beta sandwich domain-containing protein [Paenibacillus sp. MBLB4367]|uniref:hemoblobin-interacting domain-containing protein n=1 Tax=Paenibacillus sp. MBLB4367 TaxID=3384767 RepID=UPI003908163F